MTTNNERDLIDTLDSAIKLVSRLCDQGSRSASIFSAISRAGNAIDHVELAMAGESLTSYWVNEGHESLLEFEQKLGDFKNQAKKVA